MAVLCCAVPVSVPDCILLRPEKHLKHLQNPGVISRHVLSCLNASSCSLALGHSITKYCFSTCYTKSFLKAAGETCWRPDNWGTVCMEWFAARTQERHSTSELSVVTHLKKEPGRDLDVASKRLHSSIKSDIKMSLRESKSPPKIQGEKS